MHDIDRTQLESGSEAFETEPFEFPEEYETVGYSAFENPFSEDEEMMLATELLGITNEAELDQFLGKLLKGAWRGIRKVGSAVGRIARPLGGILKGVAKTALPFIGGAAGSLIPIPGVGTALGTALGSAVSKALEMELEGLNPEDREFEMARRFVRLAGTAAQQAAQAPPNTDPAAAARAAVMAAAQQQAPGLRIETGGPALDVATMAGRPGHSGRWIRRGRTIILLGVWR
jgi:hypothetical protein